MWLYSILWIFTSPFVRFFWIKRYSGVNNVPKKGGVIIAPNHQSWIDYYFLTSTLKRRLYFLVGEFVYQNKLYAWAENTMGNVKVDRFHENKKEVYDKAKKILDNGGALVVFPEGRMTTDGYTKKAFKGVAKMALSSKVDIVPVAIKDSYQIYPVHNKRPYYGKKCCEVKYLERIKYKDIKNKSYEYIVHELIMKEIAKELGHEYNHTGFEKDLKDKAPSY